MARRTLASDVGQLFAALAGGFGVGGAAVDGRTLTEVLASLTHPHWDCHFTLASAATVGSR